MRPLVKHNREYNCVWNCSVHRDLYMYNEQCRTLNCYQSCILKVPRVRVEHYSVIIYVLCLGTNAPKSQRRGALRMRNLEPSHQALSITRARGISSRELAEEPTRPLHNATKYRTIKPTVKKASRAPITRDAVSEGALALTRQPQTRLPTQKKIQSNVIVTLKQVHSHPQHPRGIFLFLSG